MQRTRLSGRTPGHRFASSPDRIARVSFAWLEDGGPVISPAPYRVAVVVWPTDDRGMLLVEDVRAGGARLAIWDMSLREFEALAVIDEDGWSLASHDLYVSGGPNHPRLIPTARSLRASEHFPVTPVEYLRRLIEQAA